MTKQLIDTKRKTLAELKVMLNDRRKYAISYYENEIEKLTKELESAKRGKARNEREIKYLEEIISKREWKEKTK